MDFSDNVIIPAVYHEISDIDKPFYTVRVGTDEQYKEGLITPSGETVLPAEYESVRWCRDDHIIASAPGRCRLFRCEQK